MCYVGACISKRLLHSQKQALGFCAWRQNHFWQKVTQAIILGRSVPSSEASQKMHWGIYKKNKKNWHYKLEHDQPNGLFRNMPKETNRHIYRWTFSYELLLCMADIFDFKTYFSWRVWDCAFIYIYIKGLRINYASTSFRFEMPFNWRLPFKQGLCNILNIFIDLMGIDEEDRVNTIFGFKERVLQRWAAAGLLRVLEEPVIMCYREWFVSPH